MHDAEMDRLMPVIRQRCPDPQGQAFLVLDLLNAMEGDVAHFRFRKKDGTLRSAYGTREPEIIDRYATSGEGGEGAEPRTGTVAFFDIEKRAWRSFRVETLIDIDRDYVI